MAEAQLGATIETVCHLDTDHVGLSSLGGTDFLNGASVWVHYEPADRDRIERFLYGRDGGLLFALPTDGGLVVEGGRVRSVGVSASWLIGTKDIELAPGESIQI